MNDKITCKNCGALNDSDYVFCKNCGSLLKDQNPADGQYTPPFGYGFGNSGGYYNTPYVDYSAVEPTLDGADTKKVQAYVGESKRDKFMQSFIAIAKTGKTAFFNWVVLITGILLSLPFASSWFFYRKMYKVGLIICVACVLISGAVTAVNYSDNKTVVESAYSSVENYSTEDAISYFMNLQQTGTDTKAEGISPKALLASAVRILEILTVIVLAVFAYSIYYKHTIKEVKKLDALKENNNFLIYSIAGKPTLAAAILIPLAFNLVISVISFAPYYSLIFSGADFAKVILAIAYA